MFQRSAHDRNFLSAQPFYLPPVYVFWFTFFGKFIIIFALFIVMVAKVKRASETIGKLLMKLQDAKNVARVDTWVI